MRDTQVATAVFTHRNVAQIDNAAIGVAHCLEGQIASASSWREVVFAIEIVGAGSMELAQVFHQRRQTVGCGILAIIDLHLLQYVVLLRIYPVAGIVAIAHLVGLTFLEAEGRRHQIVVGRCRIAIAFVDGTLREGVVVPRHAVAHVVVVVVVDGNPPLEVILRVHR